MQAAARGVERQLADGDAHAAGALVAQAQDALVVGDDDEADVPKGELRRSEGMRSILGRDPDAAGAAMMWLYCWQAWPRSACRRSA